MYIQVEIILDHSLTRECKNSSDVFVLKESNIQYINTPTCIVYKGVYAHNNNLTITKLPATSKYIEQNSTYADKDVIKIVKVKYSIRMNRDGEHSQPPSRHDTNVIGR